jgi:hypothetical protein
MKFQPSGVIFQAQVFQVLAHQAHEALVLVFRGPVLGDHPMSVLGEPRATAVPAADLPDQQWLIGKIVHGVDGVPGRLVAHAHFAGGGRDRARWRRCARAARCAPGREIPGLPR